MLHTEARKRGLELSWAADHCPAVNIGPDSEAGHAGPSGIVARPGDLVHLDFGVAYDGYRADLQRMWYLRSESDPEPPASVVRAFNTCVAAIEAGRAYLKAGVEGWVVDEAARKIITGAGYPEYKHGLGHSVGLATHDGGPLLGPRWPRYGDSPTQPIQSSSVYTLELGVPTERGYIGLEDEVLVTNSGADYISPAQKALIVVG
jgi:Xaa-Pro aminopeptidase